MQITRQFTDEELALGIVLLDGYLFALQFWKKELSLPCTAEQKIMLTDTAERQLWCTARKIFKCISGDTVIFDTETGRKYDAVTACETQSMRSIQTLEDGKLIETSNFTIFPNEVVDVYKVYTKSGRNIKTSGNHPFLTGNGWTNCDNLIPGDLVAVSSKSMFPNNPENLLSDAEIAVLAYLIGDGCISQRQISLTTASEQILNDFSNWLAQIDENITLRKHGKYDYVVVGNAVKHRHIETHPVGKLLTRVGLRFTNSHTKYVPQEIFTSSKEKVALFLNRLYSTDGSASKDSISYSSVSRRLIDDIRELLLRFGIQSRVYEAVSKLNGKEFPFFTLGITTAKHIRLFAAEVGIFSKEEAVARCIAGNPSGICNKHDRIPLELVRKTIQACGASVYTTAHKAGVRISYAYHPSREKVDKLVKILPELNTVANNDIFWDEVESVVLLGKEQTYDLSVPETNNFVANGFITHNTLSLERDVLWAVVKNYLNGSGGLTEAMFVTPRESHLEPTRDRIFSKVNNEPFFRNMIKEKNKSGGGAGVIESWNGFKWHFRIEGAAGGDENMAGIRAAKILGDEMAFGSTWPHQSRLMTALPNADWKYCGVPNGIRTSPFFELDTKFEEPRKWSRHKYSVFVNPVYASPEKRKELIDDYGGVNTQGYITQVLGEWGDEAFSSFPPDSIAIDKTAAKSTKELTKKMILDNAENLFTVAPVPQFPDAQYCIGLDYGFSPDPTEIVIAYTQGKGIWTQCARFRLIRVEMPTQARFLAWLISVPLANKVLKVSTDNIQFVQEMTDEEKFGSKYKSIMHYSNPGGTTVITDPTGASVLDANGREIKKRNKQYYTDELKQIFYNTLLGTPYPTRLWLAKDDFLIEALSGLTERKTEGGYVVYETAKKEEEHAKDALLYLVAAVLSTSDHTTSEDWSALAAVMGWVGPASQRGWSAPWA